MRTFFSKQKETESLDDDVTDDEYYRLVQNSDLIQTTATIGAMWGFLFPLIMANFFQTMLVAAPPVLRWGISIFVAVGLYGFIFKMGRSVRMLLALNREDMKRRKLEAAARRRKQMAQDVADKLQAEWQAAEARIKLHKARQRLQQLENNARNK